MNPAIFVMVVLALTWLFHSLFTVTGLGGGIILSPTYIALGMGIQVAVALGLLSNVISLSMVTAHNYRHGSIMWRTALALLVPAVAVTPLGTLASEIVPRTYVVMVFIALLVYAFVHFVRKRSIREGRTVSRGIPVTGSVPVGVAAGFLSGLSGIGGGLIILPALTFMENDYRKISGTTGFVSLFTSLASLVSHDQSLAVASPALIAAVVAASAAGGVSASYLVHRISPRKISAVTGTVIMAVVGVLAYSII